jgi:SAM-dependent methyltransferase
MGSGPFVSLIKECGRMARWKPTTVFACVDCRTPLEALDQCGACGRTYASEGAIPSAFPDRSIEWSMVLPKDFSNPARIPRETVFRRPPPAGQSGSGVYHLDMAHREIMEKLPKGGIILETGCGGAQLRKWANEHELHYLGTDVSTKRVHDWLQEYGGADLLCDAHRLPFRDGKIDVVYASAVYEHLAQPQIAAAEAARVLKPGGYFLGSASFLEPWHDDSYYHMTPNGTWQMLTLAGLQPLFIWPEHDWTGFRAVLKMGNKATNAVAFLGTMMNSFYLSPDWLRFLLHNRRFPGRGDLYQTRANVAGAIAWIAIRPAQSEGPP